MLEICFIDAHIHTMFATVSFHSYRVFRWSFHIFNFHLLAFTAVSDE